MADNATLTINGKTVELPVLQATEGNDVIDVRALINAGVFTYDPGFLSTASCDSRVTYIDGDQGILLYRGYPIEELAAQSGHLEVCYLLLEGELPNAAQLEEFEREINLRMGVDDAMKALFRTFDRQAHPMAILCSAVAALAARYHDGLDIDNADHRREAALQLIAKMPTLAAMSFRHARGEPFVDPDHDRDYATNFLHMMYSTPGKSAEISTTLVRAVDRLLLLHADHEQNASTSTVRLTGSTGANPYACIAAGIAALWGPSHGGANEAVIEMLTEIGSVERIPEFVAKAKDKDDPFKLMGFGHRVYKNFDPRANVMRESCHEVLAELGVTDEPLLATAQALEKVALSDEYFIERKLYPNVDFYSGIVQKALGIPSSMFTVIFALGRTPGWITHWDEMLSAPYKIGRPRQFYLGPGRRSYVPVDQRR